MKQTSSSTCPSRDLIRLRLFKVSMTFKSREGIPRANVMIPFRFQQSVDAIKETEGWIPPHDLLVWVMFPREEYQQHATTPPCRDEGKYCTNVVFHLLSKVVIKCDVPSRVPPKTRKRGKTKESGNRNSLHCILARKDMLAERIRICMQQHRSTPCSRCRVITIIP